MKHLTIKKNESDLRFVATKITKNFVFCISTLVKFVPQHLFEQGQPWAMNS